jgi:hypothetical protein
MALADVVIDPGCLLLNGELVYISVEFQGGSIFFCAVEAWSFLLSAFGC